MDLVDSNKRRRTSRSRAFSVVDLPDNVLSTVAEYLAHPSRALFAVAAMTPGVSLGKLKWRRKPSLVCDAILLKCQRETLDFGEIERSLAGRLTDNDLDGVLSCTNAINNLKSLKLTGCINITGRGLERLRHSDILEQLDLSLVGIHDSPIIEPKPRLCERDVLPILSKVVGGNSFKQLQLPHKFRSRASRALNQLISQTNQILANRALMCSKCDTLCQTAATQNELANPDSGHYGPLWVNHGRSHQCQLKDYGLQNYTCYHCFKNVCQRCQDWDENDEADQAIMMQRCEACKKNFCAKCVLSSYCMVCGLEKCMECGFDKKCDQCQGNLCGSGKCSKFFSCCNRTICSEWCSNYMECSMEGCNEGNCTDCIDNKWNNVLWCTECDKDYCVCCQISESTKDLEQACKRCLGRVVSKLAEVYRESEEKAAPGKCACWDRSSCITCEPECQKKGCTEMHCKDCGTCDDDISWCKMCDKALCFRCHVHESINFFGTDWCARDCAKHIVPKLAKRYEDVQCEEKVV